MSRQDALAADIDLMRDVYMSRAQREAYDRIVAAALLSGGGDDTCNGVIREGTVVEWTSQSQGYAKTKIGTVREVVQAGNRPSRMRFPQLYKGAGVGYARKFESYVVEVAGRPYWPLANKLRVVSMSTTPEAE